MKEIYYKRTMAPEVETMISKNGKYHWMIDYVKQHKELDFQTGSNDSDSWFSIYRGTGRIIKIHKNGSIEANKAYKKLNTLFYIEPTRERFDELLKQLHEAQNLFRYYSDDNNNKYEGYYQNLISKRYTLFCEEDDDFVVIDKEFTLGYCDEKTKSEKRNVINIKYDEIIHSLEGNSGFPRTIKRPGTECDFVAITRTGDILLMELKRQEDTQKIYLSPLQIGMYDDLTKQYMNYAPGEFEKELLNMAKQKKELGLIDPKFTLPSRLSGKIQLAVIVGGEPSKTALRNYQIVNEKVKKEIKFYTCDDSKDGELTLIK